MENSEGITSLTPPNKYHKYSNYKRHAENQPKEVQKRGKSNNFFLLQIQKSTLCQ